MTNTTNIDLWFWQLDASPANVTRWRTYLDQDETARMEKFIFAKDQTRFAICRSRVRRILGQYTSTNPRDIRFSTTGRDKPVLEKPNLHNVHFNLSHTDGLACLAVTHRHNLGVDLERIRDIKDDFIAYALNPAEHAKVLPLEPTTRQLAFFRFWTAKEAYLKTVGTGLWQSLKSFDVDVPLESARSAFARGTLPRIDDDTDRTQNWHLYTFQATETHFGALSIAPPEGTAINIRTRWFDEPKP